MTTYKKTVLGIPAIFTTINRAVNGFGYAYNQTGRTVRTVLLEVISGTPDGASVYIDHNNADSSIAEYAALKPKEFEIELPWDSDWIRFDDGTAMLRDYGKYNSGLLIMNSIPEIRWTQVGYEDKHFIDGEFFKTRNGANAFRIKEGGKHRLWRQRWNGFSNIPDGEVPNALYNHIAKSNKGGAGSQYWIA